MRRTMPWLMYVETPGEGGGDEPAPSPEQPDEGSPEGTAIADMTVEQQAAYWKRYARRNADRLRAMSDYGQLKLKASELEKLQASQMSDQEKAVAAAREEARQGVLTEVSANAAADILASRLVTSGVGADEAAELIGPLSMAAFVSDGRADVAKIHAYADRLTTARKPATPAVPDMGQGRRGTHTGTSKAEEGRAAARRRHKLPDPT